MQSNLVETENLKSRIYLIRGHHVMLDSDLAHLYKVETRSINQAVRRNIERFPADFMFRLTDEEHEILRSQFVILRSGEWGKHSKYLPFVFTEQGVSMLSSVLKSEVAIHVNIAIMRTFVSFRDAIYSNTALIRKIDELEKKHLNYDEKLKAVFSAIRQLVESGLPRQKRIKGLGK
ncbi:MAG: ORF6N domain-containing protein [Bdellovibrionales bacterium]|nr:ORF6N domain-containing protein [Bdellovibrionales bacterium]